jgi:hypothetical protein
MINQNSNIIWNHERPDFEVLTGKSVLVKIKQFNISTIIFTEKLTENFYDHMFHESFICYTILEFPEEILPLLHRVPIISELASNQWQAYYVLQIMEKLKTRLSKIGMNL